MKLILKKRSKRIISGPWVFISGTPEMTFKEPEMRTGEPEMSSKEPEMSTGDLK